MPRPDRAGWFVAGLIVVTLAGVATFLAFPARAQTTFSISGRVDDTGFGTGTPVAGVTMTLRKAGSTFATQMTDADGRYSFASQEAGANYEVVPSKTGFVFQPASRGYTNLSQNWTNQNFKATVTATATVQFSSAGFTSAEGVHTVSVTVTRTGDTAGPGAVDYATADATATERKDYIAALGRLRFAPGEMQKSFDVIITDDRFDDDGESFTVALSNPSGAVLGAQSTASVAITDNDTAHGPSPVKDATIDNTFFVRQHYADFLGRVPDQAGLDHWVGQTTQCGAADPLVCRINVSAAFFLSIEYQESGYLVHRAYKAAFGNLPGKPVPLTLREFLAGSRRIGEGVQVGVGNWQQQFEANKAAFFDEFIAAARFTSRYPQGTDNGAFVDSLNQNVGGALSSAERNSLVNGLNGGGMTRAQVLRAVAEDADFAQGPEKNRAFVLAQYFGYLRRNPDEADFRGVTDPNFEGYNFWLNKLNQFNGNFVQAEMVRAFIQSIEYGERFGQ